MIAYKIIEELSRKFPDSNIVCNPSVKPTEIICEVEPTSAHPEYSTDFAVIDESAPHYHLAAQEIYEVEWGWLSLFINGKEIVLAAGDSIVVRPGVIHSAKGVIAHAYIYSTPGKTPQDYFPA